MTRLIRIGLFILLTVSLGACRTTRQQEEKAQRQQWEARLSSQVLELEERIIDLETDLAVFKRTQSDLDNRIRRTASEADRTKEDTARTARSLEKKITAVREEISKKLDIILEEVARENERLLERINTGRGNSVLTQGYEHVVRGGETLSTIAREYGVTINAIVEANAISDPNTLRVGQKLFIPQ